MSGCATKDGMQVFARRLVVILAVLAFEAGLPLALAMPPALAAGPCPHEHHDITAEHTQHNHHVPPKQQHRHGAAGCLCCCVGACVAVPDLVKSTVVAIRFTTATVVYAETAITLAGRSLRPDPAPPRTTALS